MDLTGSELENGSSNQLIKQKSLKWDSGYQYCKRVPGNSTLQLDFTPGLPALLSIQRFMLPPQTCRRNISHSQILMLIIDITSVCVMFTLLFSPSIL